jgi:hypothetical protein
MCKRRYWINVGLLVFSLSLTGCGGQASPHASISREARTGSPPASRTPSPLAPSASAACCGDGHPSPGVSCCQAIKGAS